ncbi:MAG: VTT domain-containing protein [Paracoccaceae bacterium]
MSDWFLSLVPHFGLYLIFVTTLASCLALPAPASLLLLGAGGFAAGEELVLYEVALVALLAAMIGDNIIYGLGRRGAGWLEKKSDKMARASEFVRKRGPAGVFFSRWLVSPLGPYVNIAAGAARLPWLHFAIPAFFGEIIWIAIYTGLGYGFSGQVVEIYNLLGNASGFLAALALTVGLGIWLRSAMQTSARNSQNNP